MQKHLLFFMNGINKYGHTIRMAQLPRCMHFPISHPSSGALIEGGQMNLYWLRGRYQIRGMYAVGVHIRSQEIVGGASRDLGLTSPGTGIELQAGQN